LKQLPGNNAPVEGRLIVSLAMAAGYGAWKLLKREDKAVK